MVALLTAISAAAVSALLTLIVKRRLDRQQASAEARREFYVELMTLMVGRRRALERLSMYPEMAPPSDIDEERLNKFDALLEIDASPEVRRLAAPCFGLLNRFWASYTARAPIEVDENGLYNYRRDLVRGRDTDAASMAMRIALGQIYDEYNSAVDTLSEQLRLELHGKNAAREIKPS